MKNLTFDDVLAAHNRIKNYVKNTPLLCDEKLNKELGANVFFKMENQQETNSFKVRGAFNAILDYKEKHGKFPEKIVVQSSGNHAQAISFVCKKFGIKALIYMINKASPLKIEAAKKWGAEVILLDKRAEVNRAAEEKQKEGYFFIHPSDNDEVICGQATSALEAFEQLAEKQKKIAAVFMPCGGGGLASGVFLAARHLAPQAKVFACEPLNANDVAISIRENRIFHFEDTPDTVADGVRTLATSQRCFNYLKNFDGVFEIPEEEIIPFREKLEKTFEQKIEPTSALAFASVVKFVKENPAMKNQNFLVIISGGNVL
jgi:threonine dehydratase